MSIVALSKVTVYGHLDDKAQVLEDLQDLGCLHLISLNPEHDTARRGGGPTSEARESLQFLLSCRQRRKQMRHPKDFDPVVVEQEALILKRRIKALEDERDFLSGRIANLRPWGEFHLPPKEDLVLLRLWFYLIPHYQMKEVEASNLHWEVVKEDNRFKYVVVVSKVEPEPDAMPVPRARLGAVPLSELEKRLEEVEIELEDLQAERESMTKWCWLYARSLHRLEDIAAREDAAHQTYDDIPLFALQAWVPITEQKRLLDYAEKQDVALDIQAPTQEDEPPTLMKNDLSAGNSGQDLVRFYMTPGYRLWDPSTVVFFSFVVFFAMILSDVGYGLLLGGVLGMFWKRLGA
jgi:V/A-type H+-transporting ATPase subunit I